ncbi:hypothetical protein QBC43DRAFT_307461 [Cladorrhinum sp. PSN259]|nr:hypothetical protein QBC43DRAFT_307461 [Cladorrhinum sp. PSN259]
MLGAAQQGALRAGGRTLGTVLNHAQAQRRWLSASSALRAGQLVTFGGSSGGELQEILDTLYMRIVLPSYLPIDQQKKMYNAKHKQSLQNDPITMEIDGVVHKFRYVDRMTLPRTHELLQQAVKLMKTRGDLDNVPKILEGLVHANRDVEPYTFNKLIRKALEADRLDVIINSVRAVKRTGFKLNRSEIINELLVAIQSRAIRSGFDKRRTEHALKQTQDIISLLESNEDLHKDKRGTKKHHFYQDPLVLAARLHMAAALAVHHQGGKDVSGKVTKLAEELMHFWKEGQGVLDLYPEAAYTERHRLRYLMDRNNFLYYISPVLNGLTLAAQVVDGGLAMQLQNRADAVDAEVRDALQSPKRKQGGRGEKMYNWIFNPEAEQAEVEAEAEEASA